MIAVNTEPLLKGVHKSFSKRGFESTADGVSCLKINKEGLLWAVMSCQRSIRYFVVHLFNLCLPLSWDNRESTQWLIDVEDNNRSMEKLLVSPVVLNINDSSKTK